MTWRILCAVSKRSFGDENQEPDPCRDRALVFWGLSGLSGLSRELEKPDEPERPNKPDYPCSSSCTISSLSGMP
jgi:hypothetical protein